MIDNRKTCGGCAYFGSAYAARGKYHRCEKDGVFPEITTARSEACREYAPKEQAPDAAARKDDRERKGGDQA